MPPLQNAWIYWHDGFRNFLLRSDNTGKVFFAPPGADRTNPEEYIIPFKPRTGRQVDVYFSRGSMPIPDRVLNDHPNVFTRVRVSPTINFPVVRIGLTKPSELSLWPILWSPPTDNYYTEGFASGLQLWTNNDLLNVVENDPAPTSPADVHPQESGLVVEGRIDERATGVKIQILDTNGNPLQLKPDATSPVGQTKITGTLEAATGGAKPFSATIFFLNASAAFGLVQILILSEGVTPQIMDSVTCYLAGLQIVLVDDYKDDDDHKHGRVRGSILGEANEKIIVDFKNSPQTTLPLLQIETRARRMISYDIRMRERAFSSSDPALVLKPEMPLWMAELEIIGMGQSELQDLMVRRKHFLPGHPASLSFVLNWRLALSWDGPDSGTHSSRKYVYSQNFTANQSIMLNLNASEQIDGVDTQGWVANALIPPPPQIAFPVNDRRLPQVFVNGQPRKWGRGDNAAENVTIVIEYQPCIVDSGGKEIIRGGDGMLKVAVSSQSAIAPPPLDTSFVELNRFRVKGVNPPQPSSTDDHIHDLVYLLVAEHYTLNDTKSHITLLSLEVWQLTCLKVVVHESVGGRQFETRPMRGGRGGRNQIFSGLRGQHYGLETDMPIFGAPHGYGYGQHDKPKVSDDGAWSFLENIKETIRRLMEDKAEPAYNMIRHHLHANPTLKDQAVYRREVVRRYNGYTEFRWDGSDWVIDTTSPRPQYPNNVLGTHVHYPGPTQFGINDFGPWV